MICASAAHSTSSLALEGVRLVMLLVMRRFASFYPPYRRLFLLDFVCAVGVASLEIGFPLFVNYVIDKLLPGQDWSLIVLACLSPLGAYAMTAGLQFSVTCC